MRVVGPNCPGIVNTADAIWMNATVVGAQAGWG
jgi:acyl-CoA synthetase (NDP forming)